MPSRDRDGGYCNCADCRPKPWKMGKATTGRTEIEQRMVEQPIDEDEFWLRVLEEGERRGREKRSRR